MPSDNNNYDDLLDASFDIEDEDYEALDFGDDGFDDEFSDFDEAAEDDYTNFDEVDSTASSKPDKKSFSFDFNTLVIIGAVIVGGFIMLSQINTKKPPPVAPSKEKFASALQMQGNFDGPGSVDAIVNSDAQVDVNEKNGQGFLFDAETVDVDIATTDLPFSSNKEVIKDVVEEENFELSQEGQPNINTSEAALKLSAQLAPDTVAEKITMPVVDKVVLPMPDEIGEKEASLDVMSAEAEFVPVNTQVVETAEIDVIDDVEPIDDSTVVASSLIEEINVEEIPVIVSSIDMQEIDSLRARLQEMERELSKTKTRYEKTIHGLKSQILTLKSENHSAVRQRSASKQKKKLEKKPASNSSVWELRAAQPGRAWVSKVGKKDMRPVVVGDILLGMGRIRDITYQNSKWVVVGSEGKIVQ